MGSVFVERLSKTSKGTIDVLHQWMIDYENGKGNYPIGIYPEGTCSNGKVLLDFK